MLRLANRRCKMWPHRQGTHLCHVTWVRTYTRSLVNVEILAIKRHGHSVHLRKVAIQSPSFNRETEQKQHIQVVVSLTLNPQSCSVGSQQQSIKNKETSASASCTCKHLHIWLLPLFSRPYHPHICPSTDRPQQPPPTNHKSHEAHHHRFPRTCRLRCCSTPMVGRVSADRVNVRRMPKILRGPYQDGRRRPHNMLAKELPAQCAIPNFYDYRTWACVADL